MVSFMCKNLFSIAQKFVYFINKKGVHFFGTPVDLIDVRDHSEVELAILYG